MYFFVANVAIIKIGKNTFRWKWSVPFAWLISFPPSSYKKGKLKTTVGNVKAKFNLLGITIEKLEEQLSILTGINKNIWKDNRDKIRLGDLEDSFRKEILKKDKNYEEGIIEFDEHLIPVIALEVLEEDEGLYEITLLYKILLLLEIEEDNVPMILDITEIEYMEGYTNFEDLYNSIEKSLVNKMIAYNSIFNFVVVNKEREKMVLEKIKILDEKSLINDVIIPLLLKMGYHHPKQVLHHGPREYGLDIRPFYEINKFGQKTYYGAQVKTLNINLNSKSKGNAAYIANQLDVALNTAFLDEEDNVKKMIDKVMLITTGKINDLARNYLGDKFKRQLQIIDGTLLAKNIVKYQIDTQVLSI